MSKLSPATNAKRKRTIKQKSELMTQFLRDFEQFTRQRVTVELIRSPEWVKARDTYVELFTKLMEERITT